MNKTQAGSVAGTGLTPGDLRKILERPPVYIEDPCEKARPTL